MIIVGSLIVIDSVFVLLFLADAVLISRALLSPNLPCARRGIGSTDLSGLGGRAFRVLSSPPHLQVVSRLLEDHADVKEMLVVIESSAEFNMGM